MQTAVDDLNKSLDYVRDDYNSFRDKNFESLKDRVYTLEKKFNNLNSGANGNNSTPIDNETDQNDRSGEYSGDVSGLRTEMMNLFRDMGDQLNNKLDIDALKDLEQQLMDRLQEMVAGLAKQFADRGETKKALKELNR